MRHDRVMAPVRITATSGSIDVQAETRDDVVVDRGQSHPMGGILEVQGESSGIVMRVPVGTDVVVGSHSGRVKLRGEFGEVRATTRSGRVEIESCTALDVRTVSGRIEVGTVKGDARIKAANGRVEVGRVDGELRAASVSGRIEVKSAGGPVRTNSVSGRVDIGLNRAVDARADSVSGRVTIRLPKGVHPETSLLSISGECSCEPEKGTDCCVTGRTVSGTIAVVEA